MPSPTDSVLANPSKAFFVEMITRDLGISDCILDLVDNSVDHAVDRSNVDVMTTLTNGGPPNLVGEVRVDISPRAFTITDTCGGIAIEAAQHQVFLFGNLAAQSPAHGLSVYGIGMKRAFFKLGRSIRVESATDAEWFVIDIDVDKWLERESDWTFSFTDRGALRKGDSKRRPGTTSIRVMRLREEVRDKFATVSFVGELSDKLASTYSLFLRSGLQAFVNGQAVEPSLPNIGRDEGTLRPARKTLRVNGVDVLIVVGISPKTDRTPHGWYVFCNGRLVLEADKSRRTGWGEELPQWHTKFNHFVGYVYFKSPDVRQLPWTTTKQDIVFESQVYQAALREMQLQGRSVTTFLSNAYPTEAEPEIPEREVIDKAQSVSLEELSRDESPFFAAVHPKRNAASQLVSIQYKKAKREIDRVKSHLGRRSMSASSVGEYTFDYFVKHEL